MGWGDRQPKAAPQSGLEMGIRLAMKMAGVDSEEVFAQVKRFAEDGSLQRIVDYADAIQFNNFLLGTIYNELRKQNPDMPDIASAYGAFKSRAGAGAGGPGQPSENRLITDGGANQHAAE